MSVLVVICAITSVGVMWPLTCAAEPPDVILPKPNQLKEMIGAVVDNHPKIFTVTNTRQQENALYNKIDAVKKMVEEGNYMEAAEKLEKDIAPRLLICDTQRIRARSWLSHDPELRDIAYEFAGMCQEKIEDILDGLTNYDG